MPFSEDFSSSLLKIPRTGVQCDPSIYPSHCAVLSGHLKIFRRSNKNLVNKNPLVIDSPLHCAVSPGLLKNFQVFQQNSCLTRIQYMGTETPFYCTVSTGPLKVSKGLTRILSSRLQCIVNKTPLHRAVIIGHLENCNSARYLPFTLLLLLVNLKITDIYLPFALLLFGVIWCYQNLKSAEYPLTSSPWCPVRAEVSDTTTNPLCNSL